MTEIKGRFSAGWQAYKYYALHRVPLNSFGVNILQSLSIISFLLRVLMISGVIDAIININVRNKKWIHVFKAAYIVTIEVRI